MNSITQLDAAHTTGKARQLFDGVQTKLSIVYELLRVFGNSTAVLEDYLNFSGALASGILNAKVRANRPGCRGNQRLWLLPQCAHLHRWQSWLECV